MKTLLEARKAAIDQAEAIEQVGKGASRHHTCGTPTFRGVDPAPEERPEVPPPPPARTDGHPEGPGPTGGEADAGRLPSYEAIRRPRLHRDPTRLVLPQGGTVVDSARTRQEEPVR